MLVLGIGGAFGWVVQRARVQRDAVAAIQRAGGTVWYDWVSVGSWHDNPSSEWLVERAGFDYFINVFMASIQDQASDKQLVQIAQLSRLEKLALDGSPVTDIGLAHITQLKKLKWLRLSKTARERRGAGASGRFAPTRLFGP